VKQLELQCQYQYECDYDYEYECQCHYQHNNPKLEIIELQIVDFKIEICKQ